MLFIFNNNIMPYLDLQTVTFSSVSNKYFPKVYNIIKDISVFLLDIFDMLHGAANN